MTIKEASVKFKIDEKEIRKRQREGMIIGIRKEGKSVIVPDDTEIIPSKRDIKSFLLQILKQRNNATTIISRGLCPDEKTLRSLLKYLYKRGLIGEYDETISDNDLIKQVKLTDEGLSYVFGDKNYTSLNTPIALPLTVNINIASVVL